MVPPSRANLHQERAASIVDAQRWLDRLSDELPNIRAALAWLAEFDRPLDGIRLAAVLTPFWQMRGHLAEGRAMLRRALDRAEANTEPLAARGAALVGLVRLALKLGDLDGAEARQERARAEWLAVGDKAGLAEATIFSGGTAELRGDDTLAQARYEEALTLFRELGDTAGMAVALNNLADTAYRQGDHAHAGALADEAVAVGRRVGFASRLAMDLVSVAQAATARGQTDRAFAAIHESLTLSLDLGDPLCTANALVGMADVAVATRDPGLAARLMGAADALLQPLGAPMVLNRALQRCARAAALAALGEADYAAAWTAGRALPLDEAVAEALAVSGMPPVAAATAAASDHAPFAVNGLTGRELAVLRLVATGRSNQDIAEALFVERTTVKAHLRRIFAKLGVTSRAAAAIYAHQHGLMDDPPHPNIERLLPQA